MRKMLNSCEVVAQQFLVAPPADKSDLLMIMAQLLRRVSEASDICMPNILKITVDVCASLEKVWCTLYRLLFLLFKAGMNYTSIWL